MRLGLEIIASVHQLCRQTWNITEVDEVTRSYMKTVSIEEKLVGWNTSQIVLPALFLPYGFYRFEFIVDMSGMFRVSLKIVKNKLRHGRVR